MDQNFNQSADSYIGKLDHHHLLHLLREKEILIETLRRENEELLSKIKDINSNNKTNQNKKSHQSRYWRKDEHERFLEALEKFGKKDVKSIAEYVGTRTPTQVRTHAQKWFLKKKREKEKQGNLSDFDNDTNRSFQSDDSVDSSIGSSFMNRDTKVFSKNDPHQNHMTNSVNIPIANQPIMYNANNIDTPEDVQALLNGIRNYDHETDLKRKIELIRKGYLPHKSSEDITRMIAQYPIVFDPNATDIQKRYFLLSTNPLPMFNPGMNANFANARGRQPNFVPQSIPPLTKQTPIKQEDTNSHQLNSQSIKQPSFQYPNSLDNQMNNNIQQEEQTVMNNTVDPNELTFMTDNILKKENEETNNITPQTGGDSQHDNDEELENELQDLHKKNNKGLGGFLGHPVCLSPTVFIGSPLGFASPLLGHPFGTPIVTPYGFSSSKSPTSPLFFVGPDHSMSKK